MTIKVKAPDGSDHEFPDGTSYADIHAEVEKRTAATRAAAPPPPAPLAGPGMMPPGVVPGSMSAKPGSDLEAQMVPLSAEAQRGLRMITGGGATNNRALEQAGRMILEKDPTYQARTKQAAAMGTAAGERQTARLAGENILSSYAKLLHSFNKTPDEVLTEAIGPRNMALLQEQSPTFVPFTHIPIPGFTGPTTVDPRTGVPVAGQITPVQRAAILNPADPKVAAAWNAQNLFGHDVHGITNALTSAAGKGVRMSDERQKMFDSAMRDFMLATNREKAREVLDHAKGIIANDFHLTPDEADNMIRSHMTRYRAAEVPAMAIRKLLDNKDKPNYIQDFNAHLNEGEPGLAEYIIRAHSAPAK